MENKIQIRGCSENNFKNIDLDISKNKVVAFTCKGSGDVRKMTCILPAILSIKAQPVLPSRS